MRKLLLSLASAALLASACNSAATPYRPSASGPTSDHHVPTEPPRGPAATPYGGVTYQDPGTNPWVDPARDDQSTFGLDVDTASYTIAQRYVADGNVPDPASVRVEEWVNAFDQDYAPPEEDTFAIVADGGPTPFLRRDEVLLRIGIQARAVGERQRQPASLTFVVDTSGSMGMEDRLETVKDALRLLVHRLDRDDRVAIVTFGSDAQVVLESTSVDHELEILDAIDALQPGGSTNLEAGLRMGYDEARRSLTEDGIDRVVLASDGVANVGLTDAEGILGGIRRDAAAGIELVSVGVGMGNYNDALLEQLADDGDGFYAYINSRDEARKLFSEDLTQTLEVVALDARAQVAFDPRVVTAYRLLGYENRAIDDRDFTDDRVDAGAIGSGHSVTALYALQLEPEARLDDEIATVSLRWTDPERNRPAETGRRVSVGDLAETFHATSSTFRLDAIVAATAEILHRGELAETSLRDVADVAREESRDLPLTDQVHTFLELLDQLARRG
ncbi:MAG TPA: von Willebrand factor type A domain-containing protein [Candidatus Limnocylindrales bacterium]|nr:von Willebrand factor type A domain-containing protein [Candidatus Limnocylindrales bacterium]